MRKALITGITGTLGQEVTKLLLDSNDWLVVGYSRDEMKQMALPKHKKLVLYLGDVRDRDRLLEASRDCDIIFHFASLKCVDKLEENPDEAVRTIIEGTNNILHSQRINTIPRVVLSSTDKAVYPVNVYGKCKAVAESLVLRNPNNVVVRYGNVLASRGSVVPQFVKTIREENKVYLTDKNMTRFFLSPLEAAKFVVASGLDDEGGLKIPDLKATKMTSVVAAIAQIMGATNVKSEVIGIRPGEKIDEDMRTSKEGGDLNSKTCVQFTQKELIQKLTPIVKSLL